jgi:antirestriction protein
MISDIDPIIEFVDMVLDPQMISFWNLYFLQNAKSWEKVTALYSKLEEKGIDGRWIKNTFSRHADNETAEWTYFVNYYELEKYNIFRNIGILIVRLPDAKIEKI